MFLKKIPNEVQCLLNASARINNFKQAIEELVYNSLDAESSSIAIRVHIQKNWIQVVDNGIGIRNVDFNLLGERHATSKLLDVCSLKSAPNKYGYRGQALANIIEVAQSVKITSRHMSSDETWIKTFRAGKEPECYKTVKRPSKGTTAIYNEENEADSRSDELYFLFISCPYSDYDIINSGKQTIVEFQDWEQLNKLIDKLVQFYKGDNLLSVQRNDTDKNNVTQKKLDTRNEVKKIMEKVLGKHNKKSRISEVQKAIKGRLHKRKKKPMKNASKKPIYPQTSLNFVDNKKSQRSEIITKSHLKTCDTKIQLKSRNDENKFENKTKKKSSEHLNHLLKYKCDDNCDNLLEIFKNYPNTTKRRCNEISNYIRKVFRIYNCRNTEGKSFDQFVNIIKDTENVEEKCRVIRKVERTFEDLQLPKQPDIKCVSNNKNSKTEKITSHNLVQTILKTQDGYTDKELVKTDTHFNIQRSNIYHTRCTMNSTFKPTLTFQSHKYSIQETLHKNRTKPQKFISRQSRQNFIYNGDNNSEVIYPMKNNSFNKCPFETKNHKSYFYNKVFHKYKQSSFDTAFSIDLTESDITEFSKKVRNQIITDMNFLSNTNNYNKPKGTEKLNFEINFNIESTYTILQDSFQGNPQMLTKNNSFIKVRDTEKSHIHLSRRDETAIETKANAKKDNTMKNNLNVMFLSKPQETNSIDELIEPLEICEAVISNSNDIELENYVNELSVYSAEKNLPNMEQTEESNIKTIQNFNPHFPTIESQNKSTHVENFHISSKSIKHFETEINSPNKDTEKNLGNIIDTENYINNTVGNFNLLSRRGFMPKGMSPIFKNCFSKNICSYNLDVEYYDDLIYDKFFEDVVENTEVYEPHVQATKEIVTRPVQKVTDNIKKDNANLVFGTESLVAAQVVLGQVDSKFIAAKIRGKSQTHETSEFLVLFDQHAVHERIRLENNLSYYFNGNTWKNVTVDAIYFKLCKDEIIYLHNHKDKFIQFGLEWTVLNDSEIMVNSIPEAILGKTPRPMETVTKSVKTLISEQVYAIKYLKGNINLYPQSIMNLLFSEACRYAIKFGDILSKNDCSELIFALANCKTPFQCAHGRPVMAVMMELKCDRTEYNVSEDDNCLQIETDIVPI